VYQLLPEELPFKLTSCSPGSLRYALRRSFAIMLGAPPTKVPTPPAAAALAHTALTAVLLASSIVRLKGAGHAVVLRLSDCSVHDAHSVLLKALLRSHNPQGNLAEFQQVYGSNLSALLSEQPLCSHLVQLGHRPAPEGVAASKWHSQRALLRVDRVWPEAWMPRGDLLPTLGQAPLLAPQAAKVSDPTEQQHGSAKASAQEQQQQQQQALPLRPGTPQRRGGDAAAGLLGLGTSQLQELYRSCCARYEAELCTLRCQLAVAEQRLTLQVCVQLAWGVACAALWTCRFIAGCVYCPCCSVDCRLIAGCVL